MKQRDDYKRWCWELQQVTGTKQAWSGRYRDAWIRYLDRIGLDGMVAAIAGRDFSNVEYLLRPPNDYREIGMLEELDLRLKIIQWEEVKARETVSPDIIAAIEAVGSQPLGGPTDYEIQAALEAIEKRKKVES